MSMSMLRTMLVLLGLFLLQHPAFAEIETAPESAQHLGKARQLFEEQKYSAAAAELREAYRITPNPIFLFNAGQSYRKAEDKAQALTMYQLFVEKAPDSKLAAEARGYISELESAIALQARLSSIKLELQAERAESDEAQRQAREAKLALEKERKKPWYRRAWFYGVVGSLAGVVVVGAVAGGVVAAQDPRRSANARDLPVTF